MVQKEFKVGDRVFDIRYGWGTIVRIYGTTSSPCGVLVDFKNCEYNYKPVSINYAIDKHKSAGGGVSLLSHYEYTLQPISQKERVVLVSDIGDAWYPRVLIKETSEGYLCWADASSIEEAKEKTYTTIWRCMKELPQEGKIVELTIKDISEGKGVGIPPHLIRIKE